MPETVETVRPFIIIGRVHRAEATVLMRTLRVDPIEVFVQSSGKDPPLRHRGHGGRTEKVSLPNPKRKPIAIDNARHIIAKLRSNSSPAALTRHSKLNAEHCAVYKPNFCCECGNKLIRLRWHFWTSRQFCKDCARRFRRERFVPLLLFSLALSTSGYLLGRTRHSAAPPLVIERRSDSPLNTSPSTLKEPSTISAFSPNSTSPNTIEADVYICGARTKKGTPCSRRVHGPVRCWQHKGMPAMLPQEKLLVKG